MSPQVIAENLERLKTRVDALEANIAGLDQAQRAELAERQREINGEIQMLVQKLLAQAMRMSAIEDRLQDVREEIEEDASVSIEAPTMPETVGASDGRWPAWFDLYDVARSSPYTVKLHGFAAGFGKNASCYIAGSRVAIDDGTGMTWDTDHWVSDAFSTSQYIYLLGDRGDNTVDMCMTSSRPVLTEDQVLWDLWYIGCTDGAIDPTLIYDLRTNYHWVAGA